MHLNSTERRNPALLHGLIASCALALAFAILFCAISASAGTVKKAPAPAPTVKACPASTRYNPKTQTCDKIRF